MDMKNLVDKAKDFVEEHEDDLKECGRVSTRPCLSSRTSRKATAD